MKPSPGCRLWHGNINVCMTFQPFRFSEKLQHPEGMSFYIARMLYLFTLWKACDLKLKMSVK